MHIDDFAPNLSFFFSYGMILVRGNRPRLADLGGDARALWRQRARANSNSTRPTRQPRQIAFNDPHDAAGADLDLRS